MNIPSQVRYPKPLDKPDEKRETIPNLAPTEPPFAFGSGGRWALTLAENNTMQIPMRKLLLAIALLGAACLIVVCIIVVTFSETPPRSLPAKEFIPDRIVIRQHPKLGGRELATITNQEEILQVMTALPSTYSEAYCACFSFYDLEFYAQSGVYRTVNYKPGEYLRDSDQPTGQSSVPRRFRRVVGSIISQHQLKNLGNGQQSDPLNTHSPSAQGVGGR